MAGPMLLLFTFAYVQNIAFALTSRSRNRSSATYHFIAVLLATLVFFWMLRRLITSELNLVLIVPYTAGTVLGSLTGAQVSAWIEKRIGAVSDSTSGPPFTKRRFFAQAWPIGILLPALIIHLFLQPLHLAGAFIVLAALLFAQNFTYAISSRAGNRNKPMFLLGSVLFNGVTQFLIFQRIVAYEMDWPLFIPYAVGGISGSITGALASMQIEKRIGATADAHVRATERPKQATWPIAAFLTFGLIVLVESFVIRGIVLSLFTIFGLALAQNFSFMLVSRARNRNKVSYHALTSIFSNGVWFLTFRQLYVAGLDWPFLIPYILGVASGSLLAYSISIMIERKIGAVADAPRGAM